MEKNFHNKVLFTNNQMIEPNDEAFHVENDDFKQMMIQTIVNNTSIRPTVLQSPSMSEGRIRSVSSSNISFRQSREMSLSREMFLFSAIEPGMFLFFP